MKYLNNFKKFLVVVACIGFFSSCEKIAEFPLSAFNIGEANMLPPENTKYLTYFADKVNVDAGLQVAINSKNQSSLKNYGSEFSKYSYEIRGGFDEGLKIDKSQSSVSVDDFLVKEDVKYGFLLSNPFQEYALDQSAPMSQLFGKSVDVSFNYVKGSGTRTESVNSTFYIPKELKLTSPLPPDLYEKFIISGSSLSIEWEADLDNEHGILIGIEWAGGTLEKPIDMNGGKANNIKLIDDDGQFTITEEFFEGIPHGAYLHFLMVRGNIVVEEVNNQIVELSAASYLMQKDIVYE